MLRKEIPMESSPLSVVTGIPTQEVIDAYQVMGMVVMATRWLRNQTTREMMVDIQVCSEGIGCLGLDPEGKEMAVQHPFLTIEELPDSESWACHSTTWHSPISGCMMQCFHLADMPWYFSAAFYAIILHFMQWLYYVMCNTLVIILFYSVKTIHNVLVFMW